MFFLGSNVATSAHLPSFSSTRMSRLFRTSDNSSAVFTMKLWRKFSSSLSLSHSHFAHPTLRIYVVRASAFSVFKLSAISCAPSFRTNGEKHWKNIFTLKSTAKEYHISVGIRSIRINSILTSSSFQCARNRNRSYNVLHGAHRAKGEWKGGNKGKKRREKKEIFLNSSASVTKLLLVMRRWNRSNFSIREKRNFEERKKAKLKVP